MKRLLLLYFFLPGVFACNEILKVGADFAWPPYSYLDDGEITGLDIDIARHVFTELDYCVHFISMPSPSRALKQIKNGKIDLVLAASYSDERAEMAVFSAPYRFEVVKLFTHEDVTLASASLSTLFEQGATFAANQGSILGDAFISLVEQYPEQVVYLPTSEQRLLLLNRGRFDFVVEDLYAGNYLTRQLRLDNIRETEHVVYQNEIHFLGGKESFAQPRLSQINRAIKAAQSHILELKEAYLSRAPSK